MNEPSLPETDRREHERKPLRIEAHLLPPQQPPFRVRLIDISHGGLRMACSVNPPLMSVSVVRMALPRPDRGAAPLIEVGVQVINSIYSRTEDGFRVGLKFLEMPAAAKGIISAFLKI